MKTRKAGRDRRGRGIWIRGAGVGFVASQIAGAIAVACLLAGCSGLLQQGDVPKGVSDPAVTQTPDGAREAYYGALKSFRTAFGGYDNQFGSALAFVAMTGLMTDELQVGGSTVGSTAEMADRHDMPESDAGIPPTIALYSNLNLVRGQANQAIGLLTRYVPEQPALVGRLYAIEGYTEIFLAELFCSGIPLSTLDFDGDYTLKPGSTTAQVFTHALALFDTTLALAGDSLRFINLARVGQGRALLDLGRYAEAAAAVAAVPDDYRYDESFVPATYSPFSGGPANFALVGRGPPFDNSWNFSVSDTEGGSGLDYRSSGDPRTTAFFVGTYTYNGANRSIYRPGKYAADGSSPLPVASGLEARLIGAEAQLQAGDAEWLTTLNVLRTDGTYDVNGTDTLWHAGSGGIDSLAPLADPGSDTARVSLLFRERAFWLFLTGHRQGDLRRLVRQYSRDPVDLWPGGRYPAAPALFYGTDVTAPVPSRERELNPNFTGCFSRSA